MLSQKILQSKHHAVPLLASSLALRAPKSKQQEQHMCNNEIPALHVHAWACTHIFQQSWAGPCLLMLLVCMEDSIRKSACSQHDLHEAMLTSWKFSPS